MKLIRASAGETAKGRYFEASGEKPRAFYLSVVETRRVQNEQTQQWEDGAEIWYDAKFEGADADWARDNLRNGDRLLLWGETRDRVREVDGKEYHSTELFVRAVSYNPHLTKLSVDRSPRRAQEHAPAAEQAQEYAQGAAGFPAAAGQSTAASAAPRSPWDTVAQARQDVAQSGYGHPGM